MIYTTQRLRLRFDTMYVCTYWHLKLYAPQAKQDTASSRCATLSLSISVNHSKVVNNQFAKGECYAIAWKRQTIIRYFARRSTARREEKIKVGRALGLCSRTKDVFIVFFYGHPHIHFYKGKREAISDQRIILFYSLAYSRSLELFGKKIPVWLLLQYRVASTCRAYYHQSSHRLYTCIHRHVYMYITNSRVCNVLYYRLPLKKVILLSRNWRQASDGRNLSIISVYKYTLTNFPGISNKRGYSSTLYIILVDGRNVSETVGRVSSSLEIYLFSLPFSRHTAPFR